MVQLRDDPVRVVPKRVLLVALPVTLVLILLAYFLEWPITQVLIGFWVGVIMNLISFRLMVTGAKKLLEKSRPSFSLMLGGNGFLGRLVLYAFCLFLMAQISLQALLAAAVGLSMVGVVLKLDGFFSMETATRNKANK